jgi:hypothetical protein
MNAPGTAARLVALLVLFTFTASALGGVTLTAIPTIGSDVSNEARAVTPDGRYVVGFSGPGSISGDTGSGFVYDVVTGTLTGPIISSDGAIAHVVTGVAYRTNDGQHQLIVDGWSGGWRTDWMTPDGGATWDVKVRSTGLGTDADNNGPVANSVAGGAAATPDVFYTTLYRKNVANNPIYLARCAGAWPAIVTWANKGISGGDIGSINGVSASGRAVGARKQAGVNKNYMLTWNDTVTPTPAFFNGLDGTTAGAAYAISADGSNIFGLSPITGSGPTNHAYKVFNPGASQSIAPLPEFADTGGSTTRAAPYGCTPDGHYVVGMNYRGSERAVLWDTSAADPASWTITDLTDLAAASGALTDFLNLRRAHSIGVDGYGQKIVVGIGLDVNLNTRAFVMSIPPAVSIGKSAPSGFVFTIQSVEGRTYTLEWTPSLTAPLEWTAGQSVTGNGGVMSLTNTPGPLDTQRFYRVRIQ